MCFEQETDGTHFNVEVKIVPGYYLFVNHCNPANRELYHEVLAYEIRAFTADSEANPVNLVFERDNLDEEESPEPCFVYYTGLDEKGLVLQHAPIGEDQVYHVHVTKEEIDKYHDGIIDYMHLEVGCNQ